MSTNTENLKRQTSATAESTVATKHRNQRLWLLIMSWALGIVAALPILCGWGPHPDTGLAVKLRVLYWVVLAVCACIYMTESRQLSRRQAFVVAFTVLLATLITNNLHYLNVDMSANYSPEGNRIWQARHHSLVAQLSALPGMPPHSARFLPHGVVRWLEMTGMSYDAGRDIYRMLFMALLFYAVFRYARLYTTYVGGIVAVFLVALIYPVSFQYYAGQLTDPMSHLSFVLALIFLEKRDFPFLLTTLLIGSVAKESVLALVGYYLLFCRGDRRYALKALALIVGAAASYFGIRWYILHRAMQYEDVSGVSLSHVLQNLGYIYIWPYQLSLTGLALAPFLALSWKETPLSLKRAVLYLFPTLFASSMLFSWLWETRNFMPVVIVLAVVAAHYLSRESNNDGGSLPSTTPSS
jgi:hypothetical protein